MHRQDLINLGYSVMKGKNTKLKTKEKAKRLKQEKKIKSYRIDICPLSKKHEIYFKRL